MSTTTTPTTPPAAPDAALPAWWQRLADLYRDGVAHAFLLVGNTADVVRIGDQFWELPAFLASMLAKKDLVVVVDPARGLTFPLAGHAALYAALTGRQNARRADDLLGLLLPGDGADDAAALPRRPGPMTAELDRLLVEPPVLPQRSVDADGQIRWGPEPHPSGRRVTIAVILRQMEALIPDAPLAQTDGALLARLLSWARDRVIGNAGHLIIGIAEVAGVPGGIHAELRRASARWEQIVIPLPDEQERLETLRQLLPLHGVALADDLELADLARSTSILTRLQLEDVVLRAVNQPLTRALALQRKNEILTAEFSDVLEIRDPRWGFAAIGGYERVKEYCRQAVITPWRQGRLRVGGILLPGPPGTGKTQLGEAIAGEAGVNFAVFRMARVLGPYVGNSERAMERSLQALAALAPVVVLFDEIEQLMRRDEGRSGNSVAGNLFAMLLTWLEDPARRGKVLVVATTNRPDLLDAALRDRFDRVIPVLPPNRAERAAILEVLLPVISPAAAAEAATRTEGWSGRQLRDLSQIAAELIDQGLSPDTALAEALTLYRAPRRAEVERQIDLALAEISDLRLLPDEYRQRALAEPAADPVRATDAQPQPTARAPRQRDL